MELADAVVGEVAGSTIVHVEREFGYLVHFRRSTNSLKQKIQQLTAIKNGVQAMIDVALCNGELINTPVQDWMTGADLVLGQATELSNEASFIKGWFRGWCCGRFSIGRKAEKKILVIHGLCVEGSSFDANNISYRKPTQSLKLGGTEDFNAFASRDFTIEEIHKALQEEDTNLVGVYGMPGVGKTTLIKAIAKHVKEEQLFHEVVVVIVSQNPNLITLQGDIAERLDLKDLGIDLSVRADRLSERLNQDDKMTLVILDDVWERIELSYVGIPRGKFCKVVFTTRFGAVCDTMEANTKIQVAVLSEEDSWILFQKKFGTVEDSSLARRVLKECKGLPLAIVTLGRALRNKDAIVWADALVQLRRSVFEGMSPVVSSIKLSYDFLESESVKICFLFCCLFPEDHKIELEVLLRYMMGEKLVEDVDTYDEARGRLYSIVVELVSSGLLLRYENTEIMMHDVVRDVAISIAAEEEGHIVKAGRNLSYWPDMDLENCKRLSMMHNPIERFPTFPIKAPHLQALYLNDNYMLTELPSDFFAGMKSLMILDLSDTNIKSLPPSLSCLQNLRTLLLNRGIGRTLSNLSLINKLERLEVLTLRRSNFLDELPEEIGNLINLRILDLTRAISSKSLTVIPDLFLKLGQLEELHVLESFISGDRIIPEMGSLSRLTSLELHVPNVELCHIDIPGPWKNLTRFLIFITTDFNYNSVDEEFSRRLRLDGIRGKQVANWALILLGRTNSLQIRWCRDLQSLTEVGVATAKGMNDNLKSLHLAECLSMECLVSSSTGLFESNQNAFFSNLEKLEIRRLDALVEICKGTCPPRLLQKLKALSLHFSDGLVTAIPRKLIHNLRSLEILEISNCSNLAHIVQMEEQEEESVVSSNSNISSRITISDPLLLPIFPSLRVLNIIQNNKIRYVFTMRVARNLLLLEELEIYMCLQMEVLFKYEDGEDIQFKEDSAILPSLKKLTVQLAPQLKSFTNQNLVMELSSLEILDVQYCEMLERLPFGNTSAPNLNTFHMDQDLSNRLEWEDESVKDRLLAIARPKR